MRTEKIRELEKNLVQKMVKSGAMETVGSCASEGFVQLKIKLLKCFLISKKKKLKNFLLKIQEFYCKLYIIFFFL